LEVLRGDCGGNRRGVSPLNVCGIGDPARSAEGRVVEDAGVDIDETFADAVLDRREVRCPQLVEDKAVGVSDAAMRRWLRGLLLVLE
jgi:hypothetical protein